jgi:hypothetical protein
MAKHTKRPTTVDTQTEYPSLREHLATRRRFLGVAGASLAVGTLHAACSRSMGSPGDGDATVPPDVTLPLPDATVPHPDTGPIDGGEQLPEYYIIRIPVTGELSAYLLDNGYAQFYVEVATYVLDTANALQEDMVAAEDACRPCVSEYTYDSLNTAAGVLACEEDLLTALDEHVMLAEGHTTPTVEHVTLTISYLEPYAEIGGAREAPSYP